ncbi:hypothetical protein P9209_10305 [Prescottella defluvii]|nr:hypothetical protein P9209_10305 [Prescottella defluvii]
MGPIVTMDAAHLVAEGERDWCARLLAHAESESGYFLVEHVHLAPDPVVALLASLATRTDRPRPVFTSDLLEAVRPAVRDLLARCGAQVAVPALRQRIRELASLVSVLADELGRGGMRLGRAR